MSLSWPWHFISLSEDEKAHRRELLDLRGSYAQIAAVVAIIVIRIIQTTSTPSENEGTPPPRRSRRPRSWLDLPLFPGWVETRRQYLFCGLWLIWLLGLAVWSSGDDYLHFTKAFGRVAVSQLPLQVLMSPAAYISSSKPTAPSIISFLTSISQPTLTPYHRLFGRVIIAPLLFGHATFYLLFFVQSTDPEFSSLLAKRVLDLDVQCGLLAVSTLAALLLFVRPRGAASKRGGIQAWLLQGSTKDRRRTFYVGHVSLVVALCAAAYWHVAQARFYLIQTLAASVLNGVYAWRMVRRAGEV